MTSPLRSCWDLIQLADGRQAIWSNRTGRHLPVTPALLERLTNPYAIPPALRGRLDDLADESAPLRDRIVCRSAWALVLPTQMVLWHAVPSKRTAGGVAWRSSPLSGPDLAVHLTVNNSRTVAGIAHKLGFSDQAVLRALAPFLRADQPAYQLRQVPLRPRDRSLHHLLLPKRPDGPRRPDQTDHEGGTTLGQWHEDGITDAAKHFDNVETTFAHAFAVPHPALGSLPYGARLYDRLRERSLLPPGATVLEVGPGTGQLARDLLDADQGTDTPCIARYIRLDRSPALLAAQNERVPESEGIHGDATALPLPDGSVDLVLSNEVIADLPAVPWSVGSDGEVGHFISRHGLSPLPGTGPYNLGAWKMVHDVARVLRPGGTAVLTEFGNVEEIPTETRHLNHPEVSIHFRHLALVAAGCGLHAELEPVQTLLDADVHTSWLSRAAFEGMRALHHSQGLHLEARAWTTRTVPRPFPVEGLTDVSLTEDGSAPVLSRLWALIARRPPAGL